MEDLRKTKLINLGAERLAQALLDLTEFYQGMDETIEDLISTPVEYAEKFKGKLEALKESDEYFDWLHIKPFIFYLKNLLADLKVRIKDPLLGLDLVSKFYEFDGVILEMCEDIEENVIEIFKTEAKDLFIYYSLLCEDKEKVASIIVNLNKKDYLLTRQALIECVSQCLPKEMVSKIIDTFITLIDNTTDEDDINHYSWVLIPLAKQVNDGELFEKESLRGCEQLSYFSLFEAAKLYYNSGEYNKAYKRILDSKKTSSFRGLRGFQARETNDLLAKIYRKQGKREELIELLFDNFNYYPSLETLNEVVAVVGEEQREEIISNKVSELLLDENYTATHAYFMLRVGRIDDGEAYIKSNYKKTNSGYYLSSQSIIKILENEGRDLTASLLYREMLLSILEAGRIYAYDDGADYLKRLDILNVSIFDWENFINHEDFYKEIREKHGRKWKFWSAYRSRV